MGAVSAGSLPNRDGGREGKLGGRANWAGRVAVTIPREVVLQRYQFLGVFEKAGGWFR